MIEAVKEKKKPVRPHWMERYKEAEKEIERLRVVLTELRRVSTTECAVLNEKCKAASEEIAFLRNAINGLIASRLDNAVKAQDG